MSKNSRWIRCLCISGLALFVSVLSALSGCKPNSGANDSGDANNREPKVYAVSFALQDLTQQLLGDIAKVEQPNYEVDRVKKWRPSTDEIRELQSADLIVTNGAGAQVAGWLNGITVSPSKVVESMDNIRLTDFIMVEDAPVHSHGPEGEHSHSGIVATTWLDPAVAKDQVSLIADRLCKRFPDHSEKIRENQKALDDKLDGLAKKFEQATALNGKFVVSSEPSFKYLLRKLSVQDKHYYWSQESSEITEAMWTEFDASRPEESQVMLWPYEPADEIAQQLKSRSIKVLVLNLMIAKPTEGDYFGTMESNLKSLESLLAKPE